MQNKLMDKENKEFVPYEQAFELKKLGFDERCFGLYCDEELDYRVPSDVSLPKNSEYDDSRFVTAPLYSQAFKWFRDNNYESYIFKKPNGMLSYKIEHGVWEFFAEEEFNIYEKCELQCLIALINIFKIKKEANK